MRKTGVDVKKLTYLAIFTALIFVLQILSFFMRGPVFSLTFVLVPIVIAVAICGVAAGPWLGFIFGVAVLVTGDAALFLAFDPFGTIVTVLLKGTLAGLAAALVYKVIEQHSQRAAVIVAAATAPIVNSGIFLLGCVVFFFDDIAAYWSLTAEEVVPFIITGLIGINFIIEVAVNLVLVPVISRVIKVVK